MPKPDTVAMAARVVAMSFMVWMGVCVGGMCNFVCVSLLYEFFELRPRFQMRHNKHIFLNSAHDSCKTQVRSEDNPLPIGLTPHAQRAKGIPPIGRTPIGRVQGGMKKARAKLYSIADERNNFNGDAMLWSCKKLLFK